MVEADAEVPHASIEIVFLDAIRPCEPQATAAARVAGAINEQDPAKRCRPPP